MAITCVSIGTRTGNSANAYNYVDATADAPDGSLVVLLGQYTDANAPQAATGADESLPDQSMVWTLDFYAENTSNANMGMAVCSAPAPAGGMASGTRVFLNFSQALSWGCNVSLFYLTGVDLSASRVDGTPSMTGGGGDIAGTYTTPSITTSGEAAVIGGYWDDGSVTGADVTVSSPASLVARSLDAPNDWRHTVGFRNVTSAGTYSMSFVSTEAFAFGHNEGIIAYKVAAAAAEKQTTHYRRQAIMGGYR